VHSASIIFFGDGRLAPKIVVRYRSKRKLKSMPVQVAYRRQSVAVLGEYRVLPVFRQPMPPFLIVSIDT